MKRLALILCALLVGIALTGTGASAKVRHHHHGGWHHGMHHAWFFGGWHHGRQHSAGGPVRVGPHCWVNTDDARGFGYFKWCDGASKHYRIHHRHRHHHH